MMNLLKNSNGPLNKLRSISHTSWFNAIWFQSTWFSAVLGQNDLLPLTIALVVLHFLITENFVSEIRHAFLIGGIGISVDSVLSICGVFNFNNDALLPFWMCTLWIAFSTTLTRSLSFLSYRPILAIILGALIVPLNYGVGERVGAVEFGLDTQYTFLTLSIIWAVLLPSLYRISSYMVKPAPYE